MVNKTFLPPCAATGKGLTPSIIDIFWIGTAFAEERANTLRLGRAEGVRADPESWLGRAGLRIDQRGEPPMQNTLLIGLSRQVVLERQMDVVANNVANINTAGYKADRSLFEEYLRSGAHEDNFVSSDRRLSFVHDRATFHDFTAGPSEETKNPLDVAIDGSAFLAVQTPAGERYTRDGGLQINNQGQLVTASGYQVLGNSGPIVFQPTDKQINIASDGNVTVIEGTGRIDSVRGKLRMVSFAQAQQLVKEGSNLYAAGAGQAAQPDTTSRLRQGFIEKSNVNSVHEMSRMIEITRTYTQISSLLQQQSDLHKSAIEKLADVPA
jgi:flagellar basal-body rod protein FlgF/flagellar basal-body rod protein FlgG